MVPDREVDDFLHEAQVAQRVLVVLPLARGQRGNHHGVAVASQRLREQLCQH